MIYSRSIETITAKVHCRIASAVRPRSLLTTSEGTDMTSRFLLSILAALVILTPDDFARAQAPKPFEVVGNFAGKSQGKPAIDISGIACIDPPGTAARRCLVINDENRTAQTAIISDRQIVVGDTQIDLLDSGDFVGAAPDVKCPAGLGKSEEFDGEAIAYAKPYYYVVGSHGCSRNKGEFRATSFYFARFQLDPDNKLIGKVQRTTRLTSVLRGAITVGSYFGKSLGSEAGGLNIEALAVSGDRLTVGLRAPSIDGKAFIVTASLAKLFVDGARDGTIPAEVASLALGSGSGIRDMTPLPDGRTLILAGPAQEQRVDYSLFVVDLRPVRQVEYPVTLLGTLTPPVSIANAPRKTAKNAVSKALGKATKPTDPALPTQSQSTNVGKAEALTVLEATETSVRVLILFDGLPNGRPTEFAFPLK
jgi:hypothetical protein